MKEVDPVSLDLSAEELLLREQVEQNERTLESYETDLRAVNAELEELLEKTHQFDVLSRICRSLEELDELGASDLFWDGAHSRDERLRHANRKIDDFGVEVFALERRRDSMLEQIAEQNLTLDSLHYEMLDATAREDSRRREWQVEREADELPNNVQTMPWARGREEDQRFQKSLAASVLLCLLTGWLVSVVDLPIIELSRLTEVPERVAKLVREEMRPPPPPLPVEEAIVPDEEIPEPEPELAEEVPPENQPESAEQPLVAEAAPEDTKEKVKSKGILAFRDSFASRASLRPTAGLGSQARVSSAGSDAVGRPERSMVTTSAAGSSGGINLASISRNVGGGGEGIGGVELSRVASSIGGEGGADRPLSGGAMAGRTDEEIQIVFDRYKAALYRLYNRELRKDPTLRGQIILRMTIEPDGSVSLCQLQSSDMEAPMLAQQVVNRVSNFDFGAKEDIVAVTIIYPIDFLPAA